MKEPAAWEAVPFERFFKNVSSSTAKLKQREYQPHGAFPVVDQGEAEIGGYTDQEELVHPGPYPLIVFGDHTRAVKYVDGPFVQGADGVKVLMPKEGVVPRYAYWALKAVPIAPRGYGRHFGILKKKTFPLPTEDEQRLIIDALESYTSRLENAAENLRSVKAKLKQYRASVLKAAVEGRLVPTEAELARKEGRDYEPASVLLERILKERKRRWIEDAAEKGRAKAEEKAKKAGKPWTAEDDAKALESEREKAAKKYKEPVAPDTDGLPELPEGWCWATVDQLSVLVTDGDHNPPKRAEQGVPHLTAKNIKGDQIRLKGCSFITEEGFRKTRSLSTLLCKSVQTVTRPSNLIAR